MAAFERTLLQFLQKLCDNNLPEEKVRALCKDMGEAVEKKALDTYLRDNSEDFRLRMSAMGRDLRRLLLENKYGKEKVTPAAMMRFIYGHLYEAVFFTHLDHAGVEFTPNVKVELSLDDGTKIPGELDLTFEADGKIWDVKTASPYAMAKFKNWETLQKNDEFGYFAQIFGYAEAAGKPAGGWIVIDKGSGMWKIVEIPRKKHKELREKYVKEIASKAKHIQTRPDDIPPCSGVVDETWRGKKTGNKILVGACRYCPYKDTKCHKKVTVMPCKFSNAKNKPMKWYVED